MRNPGKKTANKESSVRTLTIQPNIIINRWSQTTVPAIRLSGAWLERSGFSPLQRVTVTTTNKMIVIRLEE